MKSTLFGVILLANMNTFGQSDSAKTDPATNPFSLSGYVEVYNTYDFQKPADHNRPGFIYSHNRHNEFNVNLGFLKGSYNADKLRANLAIAAGTYMNANYAAEPATLNNIYEANAGIKISRNKNLWLDAGIFPPILVLKALFQKIAGHLQEVCWQITLPIMKAAQNSPIPLTIINGY